MPTIVNVVVLATVVVFGITQVSSTLARVGRELYARYRQKIFRTSPDERGTREQSLQRFGTCSQERGQPQHHHRKSTFRTLSRMPSLHIKRNPSHRQRLKNSYTMLQYKARLIGLVSIRGHILLLRGGN